MSRAWAVAACLLAPLVVTALATAGGGTRVIVYSPFAVNGGLAVGVSAARSVRGSCWTGSEAAERSDAWRCFVGNFIYDPCYSGTTLGVVACPLDALGRKVLLIHLTKPLPRSAANPPLDTSRALPVRMRLVNGQVCGFAGGATATLGGQRLNYTCPNGAWLVGAPSRSTAIWTILYLPSLKASHASTVGIAAAWW